jgi:ABC-type multidrug transport system fused ATPase/permease subunit
MIMKEKGSGRLSLASFKTAAALLRFFKPWKYHFFLGLVSLIVGSVSSLLLFSLMGDLVDSQTAGGTKPLSGLLWFIGLILLFQIVTAFLRIYLFSIVSENSIAELRKALFSRILRLPLADFYTHRTGELNARLNADLSSIKDGVTTYLAELIRQVIIVLGAGAILFVTAPALALFVVATLPLLVFLAVTFGRKVRKISKSAQAEVASAGVVVDESLHSITMVKSFVREDYEEERHAFRVSEVIRQGVRNGWYRAWFASFIVLFLFGAIAGIIWFGAYMVSQGSISYGDLLRFFLLSVFIAGSLGGLADTYGHIQKALGAVESVLEILNSESEHFDAALAKDTDEDVSGDITFSGVSFEYPGRPDFQVITNMSFTIKKGQTVGIVGPSGSGKSTLCQLLLRFYEPQYGSILLNGKPLNSIPLNKLRQSIAYVPQDITLFGGSILENIRYGRLSASDEEVIQAAKKAFAHDFIMEFPEQYQTLVGERGVKLSGGQRQRVAIARAILADPPLLILDEATSALDSESEHLVQKALNDLMKERTSIVVAHRLATIRNADAILVLKSGQLVQQGSHDELVQDKGGLYYLLSELQSLSASFARS